VRWLWTTANYWPVWLSLFIGTFLLREVWALASGRSADTLSDWVWGKLHVVYQQPLADWDALHFLMFGAWCVLFVWLTWHFFFRAFT
jgi:hypothetical protein